MMQFLSAGDPSIKSAAARYIRRYRRSGCLEVFLDALVIAALTACLLAVFSLTGVVPRSVGRWAALAYLLPFLAAPILVFLRPVPFRRILARIDGYYGLDELMITAAESVPGDTFGSLVLKRASGVLEKGNPREVFKVKLRRRHLIGPVSMLLWIVFIFFIPGQTSPVAREARILAEEGMRLAARAEEYDLPYTRELARRMEELAESLEEPPVSRREALERIETLRRQVLRAMDDLERSYLVDPGEEWAPEAGIPGDAAGDGTKRGEASVRGGGTENGEAGESGGSETAGEKSFSETDAESDTEGEPSVKDQRQEELESLREAEESLSTSHRSLEEGARNGDPGKPEDGGEGGMPPGVEGGNDGDPGDMPDEQGEKGAEGGPVLPGREEEQDVPGQPYRREGESPGGGIPLEGEATESEHPFGAFIRALPEYSYSELPEGVDLNEYRRMIEEAVTREDIPVDLRALVRNYFMSLGAEGGAAE